MENLSTNIRSGIKWNSYEINALKKEYLEDILSIQEIAILHKRSVFSILKKLERENIIVNFSDAKGYENVNFYENNLEEEDINEDDEYKSEEDKKIEETNKEQVKEEEVKEEEVKLEEIESNNTDTKNKKSLFDFLKKYFYFAGICSANYNKL